MADLHKLAEEKEVFEGNQEEEEEDYFDNLPDPIVLIIFNKLLDAKTLCRCLVVSKRFSSLVPQVDQISIEMTPTKKPNETHQDSAISRYGSRSKSNLFIKNLIPKFIIKPLQFLGQMMGKRVNSSSGTSSNESLVDVFNWVGTALRNFNEVESIKLELPCYGGEIGVNKNIPLLKWEAGFGKELQKCVLLGAKSIVKRKEAVKKGGEGEENGENEPLFSDQELKLRIIWIISCLIASASRHNLMKKMVDDCPKLSHAVISDAGKQGMLCMDAGQIKELRDSMKSSNTTSSTINKESGSESNEVVSAQMGHAGNLVMKLWCVKELELPSSGYVKELELPSSGYVMKGATLVVIRPDGKVGIEEKEKEREKEKEKEGDNLGLEGVFDGDEVFGEAAKELLKRKHKRMYRLEMNSI